MNVRVLMLVGMLALGGGAAAGVPRDPTEFFFDQTLGDFSEELITAREQGKKGIFIFFEMDDCPFCRRMEETVLNQPEVQEYFKEHFLTFSLDIEGDIVITDFQGNNIKEKDFAFKVHRVRATPVMMFFDLEGEPVARYTGATADVDEFLLLGRYVVDGIYRDKPFTRYKRDQRQLVR